MVYKNFVENTIYIDVSVGPASSCLATMSEKQ